MSAVPDIDTSATESSQGTYLTATLVQGSTLTELVSGLSSGPAGHSEDRLIDEVIPAQVALLTPWNGHEDSRNFILIGINRSPCTSQDWGFTASCNKGIGADGCLERLVSLVTDGLSMGGNHYHFKLIVSVRNLYGRGSAQEAASATGMQVASELPFIDFEFQQTSHSTRFSGTGAAKLMSGSDW
jgi:hypothetical protein